MKCWGCDSDTFTDIGRIGLYHIVRCRACGLVNPYRLSSTTDTVPRTGASTPADHRRSDGTPYENRPSTTR